MESRRNTHRGYRNLHRTLQCEYRNDHINDHDYNPVYYKKPKNHIIIIVYFIIVYFAIFSIGFWILGKINEYIEFLINLIGTILQRLFYLDKYIWN